MTSAPIAILAALEREADLLEPIRMRDLSVLVTGMGALAASDVAADAAAGGARGFISWGFAGGLTENVRAGQLLIPDTIRTVHGDLIDVDSEWAASFKEALKALRPMTGALLEVDGPLLSAEDKKAAGACGALACDMESAAIWAVAQEHGLPFVALRTIVDEQQDTFPVALTTLTDQRGRVSFHRIPGIIGQPAAWWSAAKLFFRYRQAQHTMRNMVAAFAEKGFPGVNPE